MRQDIVRTFQPEFVRPGPDLVVKWGVASVPDETRRCDMREDSPQPAHIKLEQPLGHATVLRRHFVAEKISVTAIGQSTPLIGAKAGR